MPVLAAPHLLSFDILLIDCSTKFQLLIDHEAYFTQSMLLLRLRSNIPPNDNISRQILLPFIFLLLIFPHLWVVKLPVVLKLFKGLAELLILDGLDATFERLFRESALL